MSAASSRWTTCSMDRCPCPDHRLPDLDDIDAETERPEAFGKLKSSNLLPTPGEEASIRSSVSSLDASLRNVESVLVELEKSQALIQARIDSCKEVAQCLRTSIKEHRRLLHPIRRLSTEILVQIFTFVVEKPLWTPTQAAIDPCWLLVDHHVTPLSDIALTCRQWSAIALNTPNLWSNVNIDLCEHNFPSNNSDDMWYLGQVSRHLRNATVSKHQSLSISIGKCDFDFEDFDLHPITYLLPSYASSLTHLTLFLPPTAQNRFQCIENQLTRLVYVALINTAADGSEEQQDFEVFENCLTLRTFYVINFWALADVAIPGSVKDLAVRHYSVFQRQSPQIKQTQYGLRTYASYLPSWTPLESLCIDISGMDIPDISEPCTLLPNLKHLAIYAFINTVIPTFLTFINTPRLSSLSLSSMAPTSDAPSDVIRFFGSIDALVVRSGCTLESLKLDLSVRTNVGVLLQTLDRLPTLTHLAIRRRGSSRVAQWLGDTQRQQEVLSASRPSASDCGGQSNPRMLLPSLKTLTLDAEPHHAPGLSHLASWIKLRALTAPLKRVDIIWRTSNGVGNSVDTQVLESFVDRIRLVGGVVVTGEFKKS